MAASDCIRIKAQEGTVSKEKAELLANEYDEAIRGLSQDGAIKGPAAEQLLGQSILTRMEREAVRKIRMKKQQVKVMDAIARDAEVAKASGIGVDIAMQARYSPDLSRRFLDIDDVESRTNAIKGRYHAKMGEVLEQMRTRFAGLKKGNLAELPDVIHTLFGKYGKQVNSPGAKAMGQALKDTMEYARLRYNAAGGDIPFREDWGFFQVHDPIQMAAVSRNDWIDFVETRLAPERMVDANGLPINPKRLRAQLEEVYDGAIGNGLHEAPGRPGGGRGRGGSNVNQRANARFLVFKDSSAWLEYHNKFGGKDSLYNHIITSIEKMARDTAMLEVLGPTPEATLRFQQQLIDQAVAEGAISLTGKAGAKAAGKLGAPKTQLEALYRTVTGRSGQNVNETLGLIGKSVRSIMTSAALGGAFLSAIADTATAGLTSRMVGAAPMKVWGRTVKMFATASTADRRLAVNLGFAAQGWASRAIAAQRVLGETMGHNWAEVVADTTLRASFLSPWTEAGRFGFQVEFLSFITSNSGKTFEQLPDALKRTFTEHGLTDEMWDTIRKTEQWVDPEGSGASFIRAEEVQGSDFEGINFKAANKLQDVLLRETEYAIPGANARVRALFTQGQPGGTMWGEIMRSTAMFKSFPISIQAMHWRRLAATSGAKTKAEYAAWMVLGMTSMGIIGEQLTSMSRGRDPEPLTSPDLIRRAVIRGGAGGLVGDVLLQDGRYGSNLDQLLGPIWSLAQQGTNLTVDNLRELLAGEDTNAGRELSRFIEQNMPGRSTWYARLAFERLIFDNLDRLLDPEAEREFAKVERNYFKERHQRFFSRPGRGGARAPDFSQILEDAR